MEKILNLGYRTRKEYWDKIAQLAGYNSESERILRLYRKCSPMSDN